MAYPIATRGGRGPGNASPYVPALGDLVLSGALVVGVASSGTILNATAGSAIASTVSGLTVNSAARTYTYNGSGAAGSTNNGLTETLAGATFSPRGNVVTIVSSAVPAFTSNPSISPQGGNVGGTFSGIDGAMSNGGSILSRRWLLNGTSIGSGTTVVPNSAGSLTFENTGTGNVIATSTAVTVAAVSPTLALSPTSPSVASNAAAGTLVSNISNVPAGATPTVTPNDGRLVIAGDASAGWKVVVGMSALSAGTVNFSVAATGAPGASGVLTVSAAGAGPTAFAYQPETASIMSAQSTAGAPMSAAYNRHLDRLIRIIKGQTTLDNFHYLYLQHPTSEAGFMVNLAKPGTNNLTKIGAPTYTPGVGGGISTTAVTDYYETGIPLSVIQKDNFSFGVHSRTGTAVASTDAGALDSAGAGLFLNCRSATLGLQARAFTTASNTAAINTAAAWSGVGWNTIHRNGSGSFRASHFGVNQGTINTASMTPADLTRTVRLLTASGATSFSVRTLTSAYLTKTALTTAQAEIIEAAMQDWIDCIDFGMPLAEEIGTGDASVTADVVVYSLTPASLCAAYEAKRQGRSVVLLGDWQDSTLWHLAGMPGSGLNWFDIANNPARVSGILRDMIRWANITYYGRATITNETAGNTSQAGMSIEPRAWNMAARRMLDPTRTTGEFPGLDIPIYMSGGVRSAQKTGAVINSITMNDGRVINGKQFIFGDYDGDGVLAIGAPYIQGTEAAGASGEAGNGFRPQLGALVLPTNSTGTVFRLDPYVTPGTPASGLLPDIIPMPSTATGAADPALQSMNFRLTVQSNVNRLRPLDTTPPRNYNAQRFEIIGRMYAAATAAGETFAFASLFELNGIGNGALQDMNSGAGGISTDLPQSGIRVLQAGSDLAARRAVTEDVVDYMRGMFYYVGKSGDSRLSANTVTSMNALGLDALSFLLPGPGKSLGWPDRVYPREPVYQMVSDFVLTGTDTRLASGTTPRSVKTISSMNYRDDKHDLRRVAFDPGDGTGMAIYRQGVVGGAVRNIPVPYEIIVPPRTVATNAFVIAAPSWTKLAHAPGRMEFTLSLMGQSAGIAASIAIRDNVAVQDVTYSNGSSGLRDLMLATPDTITPVLPLTN